MNIRPEDIHVAIMTVARSPEYVHATLASLFCAEPAGAPGWHRSIWSWVATMTATSNATATAGGCDQVDAR